MGEVSNQHDSPKEPSCSESSEIPIDQLLPLVYDQVREIARRHLSRERAGHTLQTTDLVHEAVVRLFQQNPTLSLSKPRLLAAVAREVQRVLIDFARRRRSEKRGADFERVAMSGAEPSDGKSAAVLDVLAFEEALRRFRALSERAAAVVTMRFISRMTVEEAAAALNLHPRTVADDWVTARAFLRRELAAFRNDDPHADE